MSGSRSSQPFASDGSRSSTEECPVKDPVLAMPLLPGSVCGTAPCGFARNLQGLSLFDLLLVARANWSILALKTLAKGHMMELARGGMILGSDTAWARSHRLPRQLAQRVLEAHAARPPPPTSPRGRWL